MQSRTSGNTGTGDPVHERRIDDVRQLVTVTKYCLKKEVELTSPDRRSLSPLVMAVTGHLTGQAHRQLGVRRGQGPPDRLGGGEVLRPPVLASHEQRGLPAESRVSTKVRAFIELYFDIQGPHLRRR